MTLGYDKRDYFETEIKNRVDIVLPRKTSNILISGKSGSGKSQSCRWYIWQLLHSKESLVYLSDYKGGEEYEPFEGSASYASGERALAMIDDFYRLFTEIRRQKIRLEKHITLFVEEWFGLVSYAESQSKKLKSELLAHVGEILAVARGLNLGLMLAVQRACASVFDSGSGGQFRGV